MSVKTMLSSLRKVTGSLSFEDSKLGIISRYISTGSFALNRIISGDIYKGIPCGRVIIISGESASGKSLIAAEIAHNALLDDFDIIFYFDSEGGGLNEFFKSRGCDVSKIEHIPVENIEDATVKILATYDAIKTEKASNEDFKALCILDSVGGLVGNKLITDAANKGKQVSDMGGTAKLKNSLVKGCTMPALMTDVSIIFINHVYDDPSAMWAGKIKNQGGGKGLQYMSSITLQCDKVFEKPDDKDKEEFEIYYRGNRLKIFSTKNRLIKPFYETTVFVDFDKGIGKYDGLLDSAIKYGFIIDGSKKEEVSEEVEKYVKEEVKKKNKKEKEEKKDKSGYYRIPTWDENKLIKKSKIFDPEYNDAWLSFLDKFNEVSKKDMQYSSKVEEEKYNTVVEVEEKEDDKTEIKNGEQKSK